MKSIKARDFILRNLDYSTIRLDMLRQQPKYVWPAAKYPFSTHPGFGCFADPPGYPSYLHWQIYSPSGYGIDHDDPNIPGVWITDKDDPRLSSVGLAMNCSPEHPMRLAGSIIADPDDFSVGYVVFSPIFPSLYRPLPEAHPRVQAWLQLLYQRMDSKHPDLTPIRGWYPDHQVRFDWLVTRSRTVQTDWWTVFATPALHLEDIPENVIQSISPPLDRQYYQNWWKGLLG